MSGKSKHGTRPAGRPPESQRAEWKVFSGDGFHNVDHSSLLRNADGSYTFRDVDGIVAEFPAGSVTAILRQPRPGPVRVRLPARFVTTPPSVRELQGELSSAFGVQVILEAPSSKAADAVSVPE
jgi:hypothetical protein